MNIIKHEMIYRDDDVLLVKSEPQLHSPCGTGSSNGLSSGSAAIGTNLLCANTNNGLVTTLASSSSLNGLTSNAPVVPSNGLTSNGPFNAIGGGGGVSANKRQRPDDWLSSASPGTISGNVPPLTPSPGPPSHPYTVISNGYSSPMSSGSYDPYSPNGKISEYQKRLFAERVDGLRFFNYPKSYSYWKRYPADVPSKNVTFWKAASPKL